MIQIFDTGPRWADRYTVIIEDNVYGMSHNANQPNGFNQCIEDLPKTERGKSITLGELPSGTLIAIIQRLTQCE